jgi:hypothetical protein
MESLYLLIVVFFIILIIFPLTFDIKISYDVVENNGDLSAYLWFIPIKVARLKREGKTIILIEQHKNEELEVEIAEPQLRFLKFFYNQLRNKIKIRTLNIDSHFGIGDPFKSAMFSSALSSIILGLLARLKMKQPTASLNLDNKTDFYDNRFAVALHTRFALSIFDVVYSFLNSLLITTKW